MMMMMMMMKRSSKKIAGFRGGGYRRISLEWVSMSSSVSAVTLAPISASASTAPGWFFREAHNRVQPVSSQAASRSTPCWTNSRTTSKGSDLSGRRCQSVPLL